MRFHTRTLGIIATLFGALAFVAFFVAMPTQALTTNGEANDSAAMTAPENPKSVIRTETGLGTNEIAVGDVAMIGDFLVSSSQNTAVNVDFYANYPNPFNIIGTPNVNTASTTTILGQNDTSPATMISGDVLATTMGAGSVLNLPLYDVRGLTFAALHTATDTCERPSPKLAS